MSILRCCPCGHSLNLNIQCTNRINSSFWRKREEQCKQNWPKFTANSPTMILWFQEKHQAHFVFTYGVSWNQFDFVTQISLSVEFGQWSEVFAQNEKSSNQFDARSLPNQLVLLHSSTFKLHFLSVSLSELVQNVYVVHPSIGHTNSVG